MFALHDLFNTPSYENYGIIIHPHRFDIFTLLMQTNTNVSCDVDDDESCDHNMKIDLKKNKVWFHASDVIRSLCYRNGTGSALNKMCGLDCGVEC